MAKKKSETPVAATADIVKADESGLKKVKVTHEELVQLEKDGRLVGWNPQTQEATIK
jgi:hypothetical protein